jgi:hypothetical protein
MKTRQFVDLKKTILGVQGHASFSNKNQIQESVEHVQPEIISEDVEQINEENTQLVAYITSVICEAEEQLGTKMTREEIDEATVFMIEKLETQHLIETLEDAVGFELNEAEIEYVLNTLNEAE